MREKAELYRPFVATGDLAHSLVQDRVGPSHLAMRKSPSIPMIKSPEDDEYSASNGPVVERVSR